MRGPGCDFKGGDILIGTSGKVSNQIAFKERPGSRQAERTINAKALVDTQTTAKTQLKCREQRARGHR